MSKRMACTGGAAEEEEGAAAAAAAAVVVEVEGEKVVRRGKLGLGECVCACPCASRPEPLLPALADVANKLLRPPMPWAASPNIHAPVIFFFWKGDAKRASVFFFFSTANLCSRRETREDSLSLFSFAPLSPFLPFPSFFPFLPLPLQDGLHGEFPPCRPRSSLSLSKLCPLPPTEKKLTLSSLLSKINSNTDRRSLVDGLDVVRRCRRSPLRCPAPRCRRHRPRGRGRQARLYALSTIRK